MALRFSTGLKNQLLGRKKDLILNGNFESVTGWSQYDSTATSVTGGVSGNCVEITNNTNSKGYIAQSMSVKPHHHYLIEIYHQNGTANGYIRIGTSANDATYAEELGLDNATWKIYRFDVVPTTDVLWITLGVDSAVASDTTKFDEVKCIWESSGFKEIFYKSKLLIYSGAQPTSADDAPTGTLLCEITTAGSGNFDLEFEEPSNGSITKKLDATWSGTVQNTGTAGWFRLITYGDTMAFSTEDCRVDGAIATSGAELVMADPSLVAGAVQTIGSFKLTINL